MKLQIMIVNTVMQTLQTISTIDTMMRTMQLLPVWFIYIAALIRLAGGLAYFRATLDGRARPHAVSWIIWSLTPFISFFAELSVGVGVLAVVTLTLGLSPLLVVIAALKVDRRLFRINAFDALCIAIASAGVIIWAITSEPLTAIIVAIIADIVSCLPTIRKAYQYPETEYPPTFLLSAGSMSLALLATQEISLAAFAFPVYVLVMNLLIASLALRQYGRRRHHRISRRRR